MTAQDIEKQENLKTGFAFPKDEPLLIVRPCLLRFCRNIYPAAKLLSTFLYHARKCNEQETTFTMYRTQEQLVKDMCGDISEKTLHDVAVPTLQLAGFLDLEEHLKCNRYTIDLVVVRQALALYIPNHQSQPQLEKFLIEITQLEKFLITKPNSQLEIFLIDRKYFLSQLEKVRIHARNFSNCQRGRKPNAQDGSEGKNQNVENKRYIRDITLENNVVLSDDENNALSQLQNENAFLKTEIARLLQATDKTPSFPPEPQGGVTPTLAGSITVLEGGNSQGGTGLQETPTDTSVSERHVNATDGITQESAVIGGPEKETPENEAQTQPVASSIQAVDESNRQATEQVQQASGDDLIATSTTKKPRGSRGKSAAGKEEKPKQGQLIVIAPEMPPIEARWNEETAVQIIEAKKGRRYSDTTRSQEKSEAKKVLAMAYGDSLITRELYEKAVDDMIAWPFWKEHTNVKPMIKTLRKDDKIITILDDLQAKSKPAPKSNGNIRQFPQAPQERSSVLVSEEARARNRAKLFAGAATAIQAQVQ